MSKIQTNITPFRGLIAFLTLLIASPAIAIADEHYPTTIIQNQSPVTLTKCEAWAHDANKTVEWAHFSKANAYFNLGIDFTNNSDKAVTALRVETVSYDAFNSEIVTSDLDTNANRSADKMSVAPGTSFDLLGPKSWQRPNLHENDHVTCEITALKFADGSIWTANSSPASPQTSLVTNPSIPSASPVPPLAPAPTLQSSLVPSAKLRVSSSNTAAAPSSKQPSSDTPEAAGQPASLILHLAKSGSATTNAFTVSSTWAISWRFACSKAGSDNTFKLAVQGGSSYILPITKNGLNGSDTTYFHQAGTYYIELTTQCAWKIAVLQ
jgi:hypothetical protein